MFMKFSVIRFLASTVTLAFLLAASACQTLPGSGDVTRVAFGSCNRSDLPQPLWTPIIETRPDLWIWTGDIVYGDTRDMAVLAGKYARSAAQIPATAR